MQDYHNIIAWKQAYTFTLRLYQYTNDFPKHELFGVTSQLRRASTSICANIVEGRGKPTDKDFLRFLYISKGSINECNFFIELARDLKYLKQDKFDILFNDLNKTAFLLNKLIKAIQK